MTWMPVWALGTVIVQCMTKQITFFLQNVLKMFLFFPQCNCRVDYNEIQFHIMGHYVNCSSEYMRFQLIRCMHTYLKAVQIVGYKLLASEGLAIEDFITYISQQNNRGDELSLYLLARMIQKCLCVIGKNSVWYTSYCKDQEITVADCHVVLVYLGAGTVRDTKLVAAATKSCPKNNRKLPLSSGKEYSPWCMTWLWKNGSRDKWDLLALKNLPRLLQMQSLICYCQ